MEAPRIKVMAIGHSVPLKQSSMENCGTRAEISHGFPKNGASTWTVEHDWRN